MRSCSGFVAGFLREMACRSRVRQVQQFGHGGWVVLVEKLLSSAEPASPRNDLRPHPQDDCECVLQAGRAAGAAATPLLTKAEAKFGSSACTAIIKSGQESTKGLAAAFGNRGNDRAIQDYDQAGLDPNNALGFDNRGGAYNGKREYDRASFSSSRRHGYLFVGGALGSQAPA